MFATFLRYAKFFVLMVAALLAILFFIKNRATVEINFFPLPYLVNLPLFIVMIIFFVCGTIITGIILAVQLLKVKHQLKQERSQLLATQHELKALRSESQAAAFHAQLP